MASSTSQHTVPVLSTRRLSEDTVVLRFERPFDFVPGQFIRVGLPGYDIPREYSVYSALEDPAFEILLKEVSEGDISPALCACVTGDTVTVEGPFGWFRLPKENRDAHQFIFVATGTGVSPFHSMTLSVPELPYQLIHGVSQSHELYEADHYPSDRRVSCVTQDDNGSYRGRVTEYLKHLELDDTQLFYFCGSSEMIFDSMRILTARGISEDRMQAEIYF